MLPRSWRRARESKSNSSTRRPSTSATRVSSAWAAPINMVFDIEGLSQARQAVRRERSRGNRGGSPNGNGGQGARHPLAESESGMILPFGSAGGSAHWVVGPGSERADQGCIPNPYLRIDGQAARSSELVKVSAPRGGRA